MEHEFDVVVVGAGPAGEVAAGRLRSRGNRRVALVERDLVGGECSFYACMPSKALLRPMELLREAQRIPGAAQAISGELDVQAVLERRDQVISDLDDSRQLPWIEKREIALFRGSGRLDGERRVLVGDQVLSAREAVILAPGSTAAMPSIPGLAEAGAWSNRQITTAKEVPPRLTILGGGIVGVEMAQAWASLGSTVTVIEAQERLIATEEPFVGEQVGTALTEMGIQVRLGAKARAVRRAGQEITVELEDGFTVSAERLLVAVGRKPLTEDLGLESVGLEAGGFIEVDDHLQVPGHPWLYAVGDVNGRSLLTHAGKYQARIAVERILGSQTAKATADGPRSPRVVFTDPHVAAVGLTLEAAQSAGLKVVAVDLPTGGSAGASFVGRGTETTSRFVVDTERGVLVGVTFVGPAMAESLHAATIAIIGEVPLTTLAHAIAAFPTRSELWLSFLEEYERRRGVSVHR
ncbi:MAG TPA: NAD(P)/FAD-dependent oxidoreductase [Solirubrobacteraceae bacterium]|nr:NAD(P)/FAD-dependent oxidoreductase [Solirubrobacteraceae bacterium]